MSSSGTRERDIDYTFDVTRYNSKTGVPNPLSVFTAKAGTGRQVTVSESHRKNPKSGVYDTGGPFYTSKVRWFGKPGHVGQCSAFTGGVVQYYAGPCLSKMSLTEAELDALQATNKPEPQASDAGDLDALGATAISLSSPVNPVANLGTSLAEARREGIPSLPGVQTWKQRTSALRAAGSEYLNLEFGWHPLVSEIQNVGNAARRHRDLMEQYHKDAGTLVHRRFDFPLSRSVSTCSVSGTSPWQFEWPGHANLEHLWAGGNTKRSVSLTKETKRWFSGAFSYAVPSTTDSWQRTLGIGSDADKLFGIALTPDVLWELTPWSWAVDWFSNAGDVINNVTNFELAGQVMRYGYVMSERRTILAVSDGSAEFYHTYDSSGKEIKNPTRTFSSGGTWGYEIITKVRSEANPFGFGLSWEDLSPTQLAIAAAIGITRLL